MTNAVYLASLVNSSGNNVTLQGGVVGSGTGIAFPATQVASSDANTLDDYEEGTWTPGAASSSGSITSYTSNGYYIKIGRQVFVSGIITITNGGTAGGAIQGSNLPFTSVNFVNSVYRTGIGIVRENAVTGLYYGGYVTSNTTSFVIEQITNAVNYTNIYAYNFSFTYESAS